jgi:hypothetical protein
LSVTPATQWVPSFPGKLTPPGFRDGRDICAALFAKNPAYEIGGVFRAEFLHHIRTVKFGGARTDAERPRASLLDAPRTI